jgi:tetratricopeptide (TPR) repeat protein
MKRLLGLMLVLALGAIGAVVAYQAAAREQQYRVLLARGDAALVEGETVGAIEAYSGAIALRPNSMLAHLRRGETYRQRGALDAAARDFRKAAALDPAATRPLEALGDVLYRRQRFKAAAEAYRSRLDLDDSSEQVAYRLALARYRDGDIDAALAALAQATRLSVQVPDAYYVLGLCLREKQQIPDAVKAFETAVALSPGMIAAREELADVHHMLGRHADELEQLQYIALLDRSNAERHVAVGLAHAQAGHGELAVLTLGNALERSPDQPSIYAALGKVWLDMAPTRSDALNMALEALERVATAADATSQAMTLYGRALLMADLPEAAERVLKQATTRYPLDLEAFLIYAEVAERMNHMAAARTALITYGDLAGTDEAFLTRITRIAALSLRLNEPAVAAAWYQRASDAAPADLQILTALVDAHIKAGDDESARALIARGLKTDPDSDLLLALSRRLRLEDLR